jgi:hypothetical protein
MRGRVVFDTRGVLPRAAWGQAGFRLHVLGAGGQGEGEERPPLRTADA